RARPGSAPTTLDRAPLASTSLASLTEQSPPALRRLPVILQRLPDVARAIGADGHLGAPAPTAPELPRCRSRRSRRSPPLVAPGAGRVEAPLAGAGPAVPRSPRSTRPHSVLPAGGRVRRAQAPAEPEAGRPPTQPP